METILGFLSLISHLLFASLFHYLLVTTLNWDKWVKPGPEAAGRLRLLLVLISLGMGYLISSMVLGLINLSQSILWTVN